MCLETINEELDIHQVPDDFKIHLDAINEDETNISVQGNESVYDIDASIIFEGSFDIEDLIELSWQIDENVTDEIRSTMKGDLWHKLHALLLARDCTVRATVLQILIHGLFEFVQEDYCPVAEFV